MKLGFRPAPEVVGPSGAYDVLKLTRMFTRRCFATTLKTVVPAQAGTQVRLRTLSTTLDRYLNDTRMENSSYVFILASRPYGTTYVGVTSDLIRRV